MLPRNLKLNLYKYDGGGPEHIDSIQGTGEIDYDYRGTIMSMAYNLYESKETCLPSGSSLDDEPKCDFTSQMLFKVKTCCFIIR